MTKRGIMNRRDFVKKCALSTMAVSATWKRSFSWRAPGEGEAFHAHGLQTRVLGSTGVRIPIIVLGGGSRFCTVTDPASSDLLLTHALDHGCYHWDTAHTYVYDGVCSEERFGRILKNRRREVFLSTKLSERGYDDALRELEGSLKRLNTDFIDLLQIHSINSLEDVGRVGAADGVFQVVRKAKEEKVARFIGFTGHSSAEAMTAMVERYPFDTMLIALNHYAPGREDFENQPIPAASRKKMGILLMKAIRPRETLTDLDPNDLIRYALSLKLAHAAVIGTDGMEVLKKNLQTARDFSPLDPEDMDRIRRRLSPLFAGGRGLPWMRPGYTDGVWA